MVSLECPVEVAYQNVGCQLPADSRTCFYFKDGTQSIKTLRIHLSGMVRKTEL